MARRARKNTSSKPGVTLVSRTVLCTLAGVSERQLGLWEREELIAPVSIEELRGRREPLYDASALRRLRVIRTLAEELEVNLPGIEVILRLLDRME
jgi:MerR family transcriptional regulator/heat shock protein HspR